MSVHQSMALLIGPEDCFERDCEEYVTEGGDNDPSVERCSHIREEEVCSFCTKETADGDFSPVVLWSHCKGLADD